ncbi:DUF2339 domain-containing protein [Olivibacter sitiensis]|uniref:DUF2339 domain-containing protein n=1 Tax=Olivibacter sitiensis TaxID=376470 RepID=UPI0004085F94|nr:DUF2339 domain-containing protein [Olivibacter sitiensis]
MQEILIILSIITLIIVAGIRGIINSKTELLNRKLDFLYKEVNALKELLSKAPSSTMSTESLSEQQAETVPEFPPEMTETEAPTEEDVPSETIMEKHEPPQMRPTYTYTRPTDEELDALTKAQKHQEEAQPEEETTPAPSFWQRNPDLEKFIGENLFNKIGIAILVVGMGFFLKYAIDKDWINEIGRAFIGLLCGGALILLAHRLRKTFIAFSSVLIGGGIAILYYTITISFQEYQLINQSVAFALLILITAFTVLLSISYDRKELAILAILGGFSSPFMVSTGSGNYVVLFSYILLLNIGMLALAYFKKWNLVTIVSFVATAILFGSWLLSEVIGKVAAPYGGALVFASLFYVVFLVMTVINNLKERTKFNAIEISILLSNTFLYLAAGLTILSYIQHGIFRGLFVGILGIVNFIFAYTLYKNERADKNLIYLFIGLVITFVSLMAPVQLKGHFITLFWASEAVLLLWLSIKSELSLLRKTSFIVLALMLISLAMDWQIYYRILYTETSHRFPLFNKAFITSAFAAVALILFQRLYKKLAAGWADDTKDWGFTAGQLDRSFKLLTIFLIYMGVLLELNNQVAYYIPEVQRVANGIYHYLFVAILLFRTPPKKSPLQILLLLFSALLLFLYPLFYNHEIVLARTWYLLGDLGLSPFLLHYILIACFAVCLLGVKKHLAVSGTPDLMTLFHWTTSILLVYLASAELDHLLVLAKFKEVQDTWAILYDSHRVGYAVLWGISSFLIMYLGMRWKLRTLRIISIMLFGITLLKLFLVDLRGLSEGGKIIAFLSLGILLLIISFMYQRLKLLLKKDETLSLHTEDETTQQQGDE